MNTFFTDFIPDLSGNENVFSAATLDCLVFCFAILLPQFAFMASTVVVMFIFTLFYYSAKVWEVLLQADGFIRLNGILNIVLAVVMTAFAFAIAYFLFSFFKESIVFYWDTIWFYLHNLKRLAIDFMNNFIAGYNEKVKRLMYENPTDPIGNQPFRVSWNSSVELLAYGLIPLTFAFVLCVMVALLIYNFYMRFTGQDQVHSVGNEPASQ